MPLRRSKRTGKGKNLGLIGDVILLLDDLTSNTTRDASKSTVQVLHEPLQSILIPVLITIKRVLGMCSREET